MTGFGGGAADGDGASVAVEVRSVNNRFLKVQTRLPDGLAALEPTVEAAVRARLNRGAVTVAVRVERAAGANRLALSAEALDGYRTDAAAYAAATGLAAPADLSAYLRLPGVVREESAGPLDADALRPAVKAATAAALDALDAFRAREGAAMADELRSQTAALRGHLAAVEDRAPRLAEEFRAKLHARVRDLLAEAGAEVAPADLTREVILYADKADVTEEIVRLRTHLDAFDAALGGGEAGEADAGGEAPGRTLEFLTQELNREVNTVGSKANDADLGRGGGRDEGGGRKAAGNPAESGVTAPPRTAPPPVTDPADDDPASDPAGNGAAGNARVFILSGPSGSGKSTVVRKLIETCPAPVRPCVSATTRPPRTGEADGRDYHFLSDAEFHRRRDAGAFLETAEVHGRGYWYGTPWSEVEAAASAGAWALLEIDVTGAKAVLARYPDALTVFLTTKTEAEFERRLRARGTEDEEEIRRRVETARAELAEADGYRFRVYNDDLPAAVARLCEILRAN